MIKTMIITEDKLHIGAKALSDGKLVVFPTETVYGLGANALNPESVRQIFVAKGRPSDNPLIVHISDMDQLDRLVREVTDTTEKLMEAFWPGPLTMVMKKSSIIPEIITAGLDTVAIRMPSHRLARELIRLSGVPVAAPSANLSGSPSPTSERHVIDDLDGRVDIIIRGGDTQVGLESTVLDVTCNPPKILRPGQITYEDIEAVIGDVDYDQHLIDHKEVPRSPGMKYTHYSPKAQVIIISGIGMVGKIRQMKEEFELVGKTVGIMVSHEHIQQFEGIKCDLGQDNSIIANRLFACLRELDAYDVDIILTHSVKKEKLGVAIMNRLEKAAGHYIIDTGEESK